MDAGSVFYEFIKICALLVLAYPIGWVALKVIRSFLKNVTKPIHKQPKRKTLVKS